MQKNAYARIVGATIGILILDQLTKFFLFAKPDLMSGFVFAHGIIQFTDYHNYGITFSLPFPQIWTVALTLIVCLLIVWFIIYLVRHDQWITALALSILLGGAISNLIDRIAFSFVRDWLLFFGHSAVNFADGAIAVGGIWFLLTQRKKKNV